MHILKALAHLRFHVSRPDWWIEVQRRNEFFRQFVRPGDLVFDVGANNGVFAQWMLDLKAKVVSIEPQKACADALALKAANNPDLSIENVALGSEEGSATMFLAGQGSEISSLSTDWIERVRETGRFKGHNWDETVEVPVTTLDTLISRHGQPDFCKIDVEGFEAEVLSGLTKPIRSISFEYTPENVGALEACVTKISSLGVYRFNIAIHDKWVLHMPRWVSVEEAVALLAGPSEKAFDRGGDIYAKRVG